MTQQRQAREVRIGAAPVAALLQPLRAPGLGLPQVPLSSDGVRPCRSD